MARFDGKVVLITGGTRGIGLAFVHAFATAGATVAWTGSTAKSVEAARSDMPAAAANSGLAAELGDPDAPVAMVSTVVSDHGRLDVLINNAGVTDASSDPWDSTVEEWDRIMAADLRAPFFAARAAADAMRTVGGGSIIMLGSIAGQIGGVATGPAYAACKAGIEGLTRSLARRFAGLGIRVNCISPSGVETDMVAAWPAEVRARVQAMTPLGRLGRPDEVTEAALYLAGEGSSYVTGQTINVNGGAYMG
ncbi:MAG: SDR family oxidoreductase [Hyphomicrobiales bacterium]|nr:SDR family oxidoreductase [Hyphomicrobiales bacterium]